MANTILTLDVMVKESILQINYSKPPGVYRMKLPMGEHLCKSLTQYSREILVPRLKRRKVKLPQTEPDISHQYSGIKGRGWYGPGNHMFVEITRPQIV